LANCRIQPLNLYLPLLPLGCRCGVMFRDYRIEEWFNITPILPVHG
jgi:hypothetical protein